MGFKNMKRDDHGHVISNDETDGQECQHQGGGNKSQWKKKDTPGADVYEREVNGEKHIALKSKNDGSIHYFKGNTAKTEEVDGFEDSPFDDDYEEEFNTADEEYNREMKKAQEENAEKSLDLQDAINLADDDVLDEEFGKDTPERKLVGAMKEQPTGEATSDDEWNKRHQEFLERGKSTWNQKLKKGDKITIQDKNGNDVDVYVNGFWKNGELVDEDTYEEGKDNHWHDFRGVGIADKDGKNLGSINAYQIKKHSREQQENKVDDGSDFNTPSGFLNFKDIMANRTDEFIEEVNKNPELKSSLIKIIQKMRK